jgi:hypothetical protein
LLKLSPQTRFKVFFPERDSFSACKSSLYISFTSLIGIEWTKAFLVGMDLSNMAQFYFILEKYLKKFFVLPTLPSNEENSSSHHNSYNKGPNLAFFSFTEIPSNSLLTIKFPNHHITSSYRNNMPKTAKAKIWPLQNFRS